MTPKCKGNEISRQIQIVVTLQLVGGGHFFPKHSHIYHLKGLSLLIIFY